MLVHGRNVQKVKKVIKNIRMHSGNPSVFGYCGDFTSFAATRALAAHIKQDLHKYFDGSLHCLINNAGVFQEEKELTEDGLEVTWGVNTVAPWLLTAELMPCIASRIINCSSISLADTIDIASVANSPTTDEYARVGHAAYGVSKLGLNIWSYKLAEMLTAAGSPVTVNCVDPGTVATKLLYSGWGEICSKVAQPCQEADDEYWAAVEPELGKATGKYFVNRKKTQSPALSYDKQVQNLLWKLLEEQTGTTFEFEQQQQLQGNEGNKE